MLVSFALAMAALVAALTGQSTRKPVQVPVRAR
jgi:hypothetical protein